MTKEEPAAVTNFRTYLRIPSVHPNVNYNECVKFLKTQAETLGLPLKIYSMAPNKPIVVITYEGLKPELPSVLLNSHMDVVPVYPEQWTYDPFGAVKTENGNIYARGAQDMKCVGIQYIETVRRYIKEQKKFNRTLHMSFVPDEEIGGTEGMSKFVHTEEFKKLNVGFSLDEGVASPKEEFAVFYGERAIWQFDVVCTGTTGHGSIIHDSTAGEKIRYVIDKFMDYRAKEKEKLQKDPSLAPGDVTTVNLTILKGGVQYNVVPPELIAGFDVRVAVDVDHDELLNSFNKWCSEAGDGVSIRFRDKEIKRPLTDISDNSTWWTAFKSEFSKMGLKYRTMIFPGGTDSRYVREVGIPALGFSPMNNTPLLLHSNDEYLNEDIFLKGIDIYYNLIQSLANC